MATAYHWPGSLPRQTLYSKFSESMRASVLVTPMDRGPAKMRYRGDLPGKMQVGFNMTPAQVETLRTFVYETIRCTARFSFRHPRTEQTIEVRLLPGEDGEMLKVTPSGGKFFAVELTLEVMP